MANAANGKVRWTEHGPVAARAIGLGGALVLLSCQRELVKTWEDGGKLEAKVSAEKCPDPALATPTTEGPRLVKGECRTFGDGEFSAFAKMRVVDNRGDFAKVQRDEIWDLGCFRGACELSRLNADALTTTQPVMPFHLSAWRGSVVAHRGRVFEVSIAGMADQRLTIDLDQGSLIYRQVFKNGDATSAAGSCSETSIGRPQ